MKTDKHQLGMSFGLVTAFMHLVWVVAIVTDVADSFLAWTMEISFVEFPYTIIEPTWTGTIALLALTFVIGYIFGWLVALIWSWLKKKK